MLNKPHPTATVGERSVFKRVEQVFSDNNNFVGYFEPNISELYPDFLLLSPNFGIIVIEVKDFLPTSLKSMPKSGNWELIDDNKIISCKNPFDQTHHVWRVIKDRINFSHFPDNIKIPITRIIVFSQISGEGNIADELRKYTPNKVQLCFKETLRTTEKFKSFLNDLLPLNYKLDTKYFKVLRANLIPTCRLPTLKQSDLLKYYTPEEKIKLLDLEQERLARKLGEGHRLIFGVAGSGKTVILIARARHLAKLHLDWKVLILCYNKVLKNSLFQLINPQDYDADITLNTFHSWARKYILSVENKFSQIYKEAEQKAEREDRMTDFFHEFVPSIFLNLLKDLGEGKVLYDAILIDEAQDFEDDWFRIITNVLNPKTNSLLITCDGLQGIYSRKRFRWADVGIQAVGRVKRLEKSYRTPMEIGIMAQKSLPTKLRNLLDKFDEFISTKEYIGDHGTTEIILSNSRAEEYKQLTEKILRLLNHPQELLVLFKYNPGKFNYDHPFFRELEKSNIQWKELEKHNLDSTGLVIGTIHGSKGLECNTIIIPEVNTYLTNSERQLLYVAITRSKKKLILSAHESTLLIKNFESAHVLENKQLDKMN